MKSGHFQNVDDSSQWARAVFPSSSLFSKLFHQYPNGFNYKIFTSLLDLLSLFWGYFEQDYFFLNIFLLLLLIDISEDCWDLYLSTLLNVFTSCRNFPFCYIFLFWDIMKLHNLLLFFSFSKLPHITLFALSNSWPTVFHELLLYVYMFMYTCMYLYI